MSTPGVCLYLRSGCLNEAQQNRPALRSNFRGVLSKVSHSWSQRPHDLASKWHTVHTPWPSGVVRAGIGWVGGDPIAGTGTPKGPPKSILMAQKSQPPPPSPAPPQGAPHEPENPRTIGLPDPPPPEGPGHQLPGAPDVAHLELQRCAWEGGAAGPSSGRAFPKHPTLRQRQKRKRETRGAAQAVG